MRPKKVILLVHGYDDELRSLEYTINLWGYRVLTTHTAEDALGILGGGFLVEVILVPSIIGSAEPFKSTLGRELIAQLHDVAPETRSILLAKSRHGMEHSLADAFLKREAREFMRELRERLRFLTARKRGPKRSVIDREKTAVTA